MWLAVVTEADWDKISGREISHSSRPSHTPTTNSETWTTLLAYLYDHHIKRSKSLVGPWKIIKGFLLNYTFTSLFLFFIFSNITVTPSFLVPVTSLPAGLLLLTELCSPCCKTTTSLQFVCTSGDFFKGVVDWFFSRLDCVYGVQSSMCSCLVFLKTHYFSHNLPLFHTSLSLLWQTPRFISWFYEAPPSEIRDGLRLVSWLSVLWLAKPPLLHVWTSRPSPQWHVLRLNCKQWRCL